MAPSCYLPMPFCPLIDPLSRSVSDSLSLPLLSRKSVYSESLSLFLSGRSLSTCPSIGLCRERETATMEDWRSPVLFSLPITVAFSHSQRRRDWSLAYLCALGWPTWQRRCTLAVVLSHASRVPLLRVKRRAKGREHTPSSVAYIGPGRRRGVGLRVDGL